MMSLSPAFDSDGQFASASFSLFFLSAMLSFFHLSLFFCLLLLLSLLLLLLCSLFFEPASHSLAIRQGHTTPVVDQCRWEVRQTPIDVPRRSSRDEPFKRFQPKTGCCGLTHLFGPEITSFVQHSKHLDPPVPRRLDRAHSPVDRNASGLQPQKSPRMPARPHQSGQSRHRSRVDLVLEPFQHREISVPHRMDYTGIGAPTPTERLAHPLQDV